jgi:hypothetical protein
MRIEVLQYLLENSMLNRVTALVEYHQTGLVTHWGGMRGDKFLGHPGIEF